MSSLRSLERFAGAFNTAGVKLKGKAEVDLKDPAKALKTSSDMIANLEKYNKVVRLCLMP